MKITEVRVFPVKNEDEKLKAFATITLDNCFVVRDLKVIHGRSGLFIAMPSRKKKDGTYADVAHPLNSETRKEIEQAVIDEYRRQAEGAVPEVRDISKTESSKDHPEDSGNLFAVGS
jgi:stage V sporulation protein G